MWMEFTTTLLEHSIHARTATSCVTWIAFLLSRGVFVKHGRGIRRTTALCDCLKEVCFIPLEE